MKICIAIDSWKLRTFTRRLTKAGYTYEQTPGLTADTLHLFVVTDDKDALQAVVVAANNEAARVGKP